MAFSSVRLSSLINVLSPESTRFGRVLAILSLCGACSTRAQNILPNAGFEEGDQGPAGWRLAEGVGEWGHAAHGGLRGVTVEGAGEDQSSWRTEAIPMAPGRLYRLQFYGRRERGATGTAVSGTGRVNRDISLGDDWERHQFVFAAPVDGATDFVRLGQWHVRGKLSFDDVSLVEVIALHARASEGGDLALGEGESIRRGIYRFEPELNWLGANYHRPLTTNRAGFNSNRWLFAPGAEVVYRQEVAGFQQKNARVKVGINYHVGGTLRVEVSREGSSWTSVGEFGADRRGGEVELPAVLFPADQILVRLSQAGQGAGFQVDTYRYEAALEGAPPELEGETRFFDVDATSPLVGVGVREFTLADAAGKERLVLAVTNLAPKAISLNGQVSLEVEGGKPGAATKSVLPEIRLALGEVQRVNVSCSTPPSPSHRLRLQLTDANQKPVFAGRLDVQGGPLSDNSFGYLLKGGSGLDLWWCESGWKVGRGRALPARPARERLEPVALSAARGEFEAVQVVLRPTQESVLRNVEVEPLRNLKSGEPLDATVRVDEVAYVRVTHPTDATCTRGWYPDPLPPLRAPLALRAGQNQPLWLTVHVGTGARPGDYQGNIRLQTSLGRATVPFKLHVYDFALPRETHLRSALGLGAGAINQYHGLKDPVQQREMFDKYLSNFAEHRISPYSFYDHASIDVSFTGEGDAKKARVDFAQFDKAAARWLGEGGFNTFQLPVLGMGGGTFHSRYMGELGGFREGTPEHSRLFKDYLGQVEQHLQEKGWLDKAFTYWFDEPEPKDYEFVVAGMKRLKAAAPGIKRMLTEQPEPALMGNVDIWCGLTPEWTIGGVRARREAGEDVWWYICTGPKAPYVTEFIDHPGTELRLWPWQSWQYGVTGVLVWASVYWTSPLVYPEPLLQDPWEDPMSWLSGYGVPVGQASPWGNGDGRFLYPPRRDPNAASAPCLDAPINSIRWENLRDGMEDYEYFWVLSEAVRRMEAREGATARVRQAKDLLTVPANVSRDLTHFTTDPRTLLEHRERLARAIERLQALLK